MIIENTINKISQHNAEFQKHLDEVEQQSWEAAVKDAEKRARFKKGDLVTAELGTHKRPQVVMVTKVYCVNDTVEQGFTWHQEDYEIMLQTGQLRHWSFYVGDHPDIRDSYAPQLIKKAEQETE